MVLSRKDFLKLSFSTVGLFAVSGGLTRYALFNTASIRSLNDNRMAILYDSSKCIGCRLCEAACRMENHLSQERELGELSKTSWTAIKTTKNVNGQDLFLKLQCMHCTDASCVAVCPTGAAAHIGEYVEINQDWCIGCGYCEESCPYGVPHREPPEGSARKCTFCFDRVKTGSNPACAAACPTGATSFGARTDLLTNAKTEVKNLVKSGWPEAQLYGENDLGGLGVIYILLKPPAFYGLPEQPRQATKNVLAQWASGGLTAAALVVPFWFFFKHTLEKDKQTAKQKEGE